MKIFEKLSRFVRVKVRDKLFVLIATSALFLTSVLIISLLTPLTSSTAAPVSLTPAPIVLHQLREASAIRGIRVGVTDAGFGSALYRNTVPVGFSSITPESVMKFENIHPCPPVWLINSNPTVFAWVQNHGTDRPQVKYHCGLASAAADEWEWDDTDTRVDWADQNHVGFRGHTLLWALQNPGWLSDPSVVLSVSEREQIMEDHIYQILERYCPFNNVYQYDIVNEAINLDGTLRSSPWSTIPDYIDKAYRHARTVLDQCGRTDVKLFYNDFDFEYGGEKADSIYAYLEQLLLNENPVPIDGIGFQTHSQGLENATQPHDTSALVSTMNRFSVGLGLEVAITETDLPIGGIDPKELFEAQGAWYAGRMQACLLAQQCTGYTTWGTHDGASWRNYVPKYGDVDPLMFEDAGESVYDPELLLCFPTSLGSENESFQASKMYCPKPAYGSVYDALVEGISKVFLPFGYRSAENIATSANLESYPSPVLESSTSERAYPSPKHP